MRIEKMNMVQRLIIKAIIDNHGTTTDLEYWDALTDDTDINVYHYGDELGVTLYEFKDGALIESNNIQLLTIKIGKRPMTLASVIKLMEEGK